MPSGSGPIGQAPNKFEGNYDGASYKITNLNSPLFGVVDGGLITGVQIESSTISGKAALIDTLLSGEVRFSTVRANVSVVDDGVGGIVGEVGEYGAPNVSVTLRDLSFTGNVNGSNGVGGIAGQVWGNADLDVTNVSASGIVAGKFGIGGAVGLIEGGTTDVSIVDSESDATVTQSVGDASRAWAGGLIGVSIRTGAGVTTISQSSAAGNIQATNNGVGGLLGFSSGKIQINSSHATGDVSVTSADRDSATSIGGLIGGLEAASDSNVSDSYATGDVDATIANDSRASILYLGGLIGYFGGISSTNAISNSHATGDVTASAPNSGSDVEDLGGFIGHVNRVEIEESYATGDVSGRDQTGGFFGEALGGDTSIVRSFASGVVNAPSGILVGGFGGWLRDGSIDQSYSTGAVVGSDYTGGLLGISGYLGIATVSNAYSWGQVSGSSGVGSLIGAVLNGTQLSEAYGSGAVTGESSVGGAFGEVDPGVGSLSASRTYWNSQVSELSNAAGLVSGTPILTDVTGLTTTQMRTSSSFSSWDFSSVWGYQCSSSIYPQLRAINSNATATSCPIPSPDSGGGTQPAPSSPTITPPASSAEALDTLAATAPAPQQPGSASMLIGGQPVAVQQTPQRRGQGIELTAGPVTFQLRSQTPSGRGVPTSPDGSLVIASSGKLPITGDGLLPGSLITQTLNSDPIDLGTTTVGRNGTVASDALVPGSAPKGDHTLILTGTTKDGDPFTLAIGVVVTSPAAALGASPIVTITPSKLTPSGHVQVKATGVQARCTVTFTLGKGKTRTTANVRGIAVAALTVPAGKSHTMPLTTKVGGKGCEPVQITKSIRVASKGRNHGVR